MTATAAATRRPLHSGTKRWRLPFTTEQLESFALVLIVVVVGLAAGAASFTHVHDWTMKHVTPGTSDWFGWANACISDLLPIGAFLDIKRRRRAKRTYRLSQTAMFGGMLFSLAAQLAVADPSISGWLLSAIPSLAFMMLSKMVLSSGKLIPKVTPIAQPKPVVDSAKPAPAELPSEPKKDDLAAKRKRLPEAELRRLIEELEQTEPGLTREQQGERLGVSGRRVRDVANKSKELVAA